MNSLAIFALTIIELTSKVDTHIYLDMKPNSVLEEPAKTYCGIKNDGSHVFIIEISKESLSRTDLELKEIAAHEVCHVLKHESILCDKDLINNLSGEKRMKMEEDANKCASILLATKE